MIWRDAGERGQCHVRIANSRAAAVLASGWRRRRRGRAQARDRTSHGGDTDGFDQDFKETMTTMFWVGEPADAANDFIPNHESYWDKDWLANFGGVDDPIRPRTAIGRPASRRRRIRSTWRCPTASSPSDGRLKIEARERALVSPRRRPAAQEPLGRDPARRPLLLRPMAGCRSVRRGRLSPSCSAPSHIPLNTFDAKAGLDVSPAVWHASRHDARMRRPRGASSMTSDVPRRAVDRDRHRLGQQSLSAPRSCRSASQDCEHLGRGGEVAPAVARGALPPPHPRPIG